MTTPIPIHFILVDEAQHVLARPNILVLDVRDPVAFERGRIDSATLVNGDTVFPLLRRTPKTTPVLIYCYHGNASQEYAQMFADFGFTEVYSLDGGFEAWQRAQADAAPATVIGDATGTWLLDQGFSAGELAARAADGMTPLMVAARLANPAVVADLLRAGARLDTRNADGNTALWMACVGGAIEVIDLLIASGIDLNNQNDNGATCLMYAASKGNASLTARLISAGADLSRETLDGFTALDLAANRECLDLLRRSDRFRISMSSSMR
jgi:thiosulfate/3-mercaptopyruvate sulfurtransferase